MASEAIFTNREFAIGVWGMLALAVGAANPRVRSSMKGLVHAFLQPTILRVYVAMVAYVALVVTGLRAIGLWELRQLKDTIVWFGLVAATSLFQLPQSADDHVYFKDAIKDNLRLILVIEFIVASYTFSLLAELVLVPIATFLALMIVVAERHERFEVVARFLNGVALGAGALVLGTAIYQLAKDFFDFATPQTMVDFALPVILSLLFLPFVFATTLVTNYQFEYQLIERALKNDRLGAYAWRQARRRFGWRTSLMKRWRRDLFLDNYQTTRDIDRSIDAVFERRRRERNPPAVPFSQGWSPYLAKEFLAGEGLSTGYYEPVPGQCWRACKSRDVSDNRSLSTLEYYVEGDSVAATTLGLELNAFHREPIEDMKEFARLATVLYEAALQKKMPEELVERMLLDENVERSVDGRVIKSSYKDWTIKDRSAFTLEFLIQVEK